MMIIHFALAPLMLRRFEQDGQTALMWAAWTGSSTAIVELLAGCAAVPRGSAAAGASLPPAPHAVAAVAAMCVPQLARQECAALLAAWNRRGETAAEQARNRGHLEVAEVAALRGRGVLPARHALLGALFLLLCYSALSLSWDTALDFAMPV